jgi:hypothetical protein
VTGAAGAVPAGESPGHHGEPAESTTAHSFGVIAIWPIHQATAAHLLSGPVGSCGQTGPGRLFDRQSVKFGYSAFWGLSSVKN